MENKFFSLIKPYLSYIDSGKLYKQPFRILYQTIAILMLLFPLAGLFQLIITGSFEYVTGDIILCIIMIWLVFAAAGWFSFQLWWNRAAQLKQTSTEGDDFVATPVLSNLIQTFGEWFGSYIAAVGFAVTLLALIFTADGDIDYIPFIPDMMLNGLHLLLFPIYGFITVVLFRWFAEGMRALVAIANNTRK